MVTVRVGAMTWEMKELAPERTDVERKFILLFKEERAGVLLLNAGQACTFKE